MAWNAAINLTSIRDADEIAIRHVVDSLVALRSLESFGRERFLDLGSGGGFPGIPLAIAASASNLLLVESIGKKTRFLDAALDVVRRAVDARSWRTFRGRAEALARDPAHRCAWPVVTARAVATLAELVELSFPLLQPGGRLLAWKSGDPHDPGGLGGEVAAAERAAEAIGGGAIVVDEPLSALSWDGTGALTAIRDHRIVVVTRGPGPVDDRWPRDPAERRRRHWA
jgi:16S rRNA (guanine527-N7)-methyltransferase